MAERDTAVANSLPRASKLPSSDLGIPDDVDSLREEMKQLADMKARAEACLVQLQIANTKLVSEQLIHCQRLQTAQAFLEALQSSFFWKLTGPLRYLRNLLKPRGCAAQHLIPVQHLEPAANEPAGCWRAVGFDPQLIVHCWMPAGWVRFRIHLTNPETSEFDLFADHGEGFWEGASIERLEYAGKVQTEFYVHFARPIFALRLDPSDREGQVRIEAFEACPVPTPRLFLHRIRSTLGRLREARRAGQSPFRLFADLVKGKMTPGLPGPQKKTRECLRLEKYQNWFELQRPNEAERGQMRAEAAAWFETPVLFSVLMPVHEVPLEFLRAAIESVRRQIYPHWELCLAVDGIQDANLHQLLNEYVRKDERIHVVFLETNQGVSAASNAALEMARGDFLALLDHDDELSEDALWRMAQSLAGDIQADMLYSDEDKLNLEGKHVQPHFKPAWSPELLLSYMYTCHLGVYRTALVRQLGGFRSRFDLAQDYDLALRVARAGRVRHVPGVLYHWRMLPTSTATSGQAKPRAHEAAQRALEAHLAETGRHGRVERGLLPGLFRVRFAIENQPLVSIVIPTACAKAEVRKRSVYLLANCLASIRRSTYPNFEIVVIDNGDMPADLKLEIAPYNVRVLTYTGPLNLSTKLNQGAAEARGEQLVFLNDDIEVITPDWLESMLEISQQPEIGAVGAKLYFGDDHLQHVGVLMQGGSPVHLYHRYPKEHPGYFGCNLVVRNYACVTGACFMTRRDVFQASGGFDEAFTLTHGDIDYCMKVFATGKRIVFTPHAELYHFESLSRPKAPGWEGALFRERWAEQWMDDRHSNPHLTLDKLELALDPHCWLSAERALQLDREGAPVTARSLERTGVDLKQASAAEVALSETAAARWVLGLLIQDSSLRSRFVRPLSAGVNGEFALWLSQEYARNPCATAQGKLHLDNLFRATPGDVVRQFYDHSFDLRKEHPLAQTPAGRWRFLRWLLQVGMEHERLTVEQVVWFLLETDDDPAGKIDRAYRINPDWQKRFPLALTCFGRAEFLRALAKEEGLEESIWFRDLELPQTLSALDELKLLVTGREDLRTRHPDAFADQEQLAELLANLPGLDEAWLERLRTEIDGADLTKPGANLFGHFCFASGLNVAIRSTEQCLQQAGVALGRRDVPCGPRQNLPERDACLDLEIHDVTLLHVAPQPMLDYFYPLSGLHMRPDVARVAVWYWELESAPAAWKMYARYLEEIWAPTRFIARALEPIMPGAVVLMPPGVALPQFPARRRSEFKLPDHEFLFLNMFDMTSGVERKNPLAIIAAFQQAFRPNEPVRLVLKVSRAHHNRTRWNQLREIARTDARVTLLDTILSRADTLALMASADAYVSLHRSEGFGLTLAESMLLGKPVLATAYSGNTDFMTPDNSYLVDYEVVPIADDLPIYERGMYWAEPSIAHAATQMRAIFEDRARAKVVGARAQMELQESLDPLQAGQRMRKRLEEIRARRQMRATQIS